LNKLESYGEINKVRDLKLNFILVFLLLQSMKVQEEMNKH